MALSYLVTGHDAQKLVQRMLSTSATRSVGVAVTDALSPRSEALMGDRKDRSPSRAERSGVHMEGVLAESSGDCDRDVRDSLSSVLSRQEDAAAGFKLALLALLARDLSLIHI